MDLVCGLGSGTGSGQWVHERLQRDRPIVDTCGSCRTPDARTVISFPNAERSVEVFGDRHRFGPQSRDTTTFCQLCQAIAGEAHRWDQDRIRQLQEAPSKCSPAFLGPTTGERSTPGIHDALAEPHVVEIRRCQVVRLHEPAELAHVFATENRSQKVVVEYDETHVVARSGSSAREATNAA